MNQIVVYNGGTIRSVLVAVLFCLFLYVEAVVLDLFSDYVHANLIDVMQRYGKIDMCIKK